ncbi:Cof-type HAD-IIB family hydrolase [Oenococcus sicerae]|uniref:Cof-type HAD-IIB family hydrolase n=1 Tax=Oenococcus sicerae TaxID=2203724 RepID=UPI0010BB66B2|nr:hypothetical protein OAL24_01634 [Oenococcus sicerae]
MNPKKIVFFDLDGTLCPNYNMRVSGKLLSLFPRFKDEGILPIVATGRSLYEVKTLLTQLHVDSYILANGCYVVYQGKVLHNHSMPKNLIHSVKKFAARQQRNVGFFNQFGYAVTGINELTHQHVQSMHLDQIPVDPLFYEKQAINFLNIYLPAPEETIYKKVFKNRVTICRYAPLAVDVMPANVSKAQAIEELLSAENLSNIPTYAFGDQNNDLTMFNQVDYGIAMQQATIELKRRASYVAKSDQGVLEGIEHYQLLPLG